MSVSTSYHPTVNNPYKFLSKGVMVSVLLYRIQVLYTDTNEANQEADVSVVLGHSP